jgi:hypothetical protein
MDARQLCQGPLNSPAATATPPHASKKHETTPNEE